MSLAVISPAPISSASPWPYFSAPNQPKPLKFLAAEAAYKTFEDFESMQLPGDVVDLIRQQLWWFPSGKLHLWSLRDGPLRWKRMWWPSGLPHSSWAYRDEDGSLEGVHQAWWSNGQLRTEGEWSRGQKIGVHREFAEDGALVDEEIFYDVVSE